MWLQCDWRKCYQRRRSFHSCRYVGPSHQDPVANASAKVKAAWTLSQTPPQLFVWKAVTRRHDLANGFRSAGRRHRCSLGGLDDLALDWAYLLEVPLGCHNLPGHLEQAMEQSHLPHPPARSEQ